ncbi:MAG: ATP-binding protein, partial [Pedobacter sp.]
NNSIYTETGKTTRGTNDEKGTGIGLTLCKKFSELMKGKLTAKSDESGSTLTLKLPLYK